MAEEMTASEKEEFRANKLKVKETKASSRFFYGRTTLRTDVEDITEENVVSVLNDVLPDHRKNSSEIEYLYNYYRGDQPIQYRQKAVRPEICNRILVNRANEIVSFKTGYLLGEPIQYVSREGSKELLDNVTLLNEYMFAEGKSSKDKELAEWFSATGVAFRLILPDEEFQAKGEERDHSPFEIFTLDPRYTGVIYSSGINKRPLMGFTSIENRNHEITYCCYTRTDYFEIRDDKVINHKSHYLSEVPIIEYPCNNARLGDFETVLSLLDAINTTASNRVDGVEQFIQALMMFKGVDIDDVDFERLKELGGLKVPENGDVKYLIQELNQTQTQTVIDDMYATVLTVVGMPNRNGGSSTSDTGAAVTMRDGWTDAEARAKSTEEVFKLAERRFLKIVFRIINKVENKSLTLHDVDIRFTRRNYENTLQKSQVLTTMLNNDQIHPRLGFEYCGMFTDAQMAYQISKEYNDELRAEEERKSAIGNEEGAEADTGEYQAHRDLSQTENPCRTTSRKGQSSRSQIRKKSEG